MTCGTPDLPQVVVFGSFVARSSHALLESLKQGDVVFEVDERAPASGLKPGIRVVGFDTYIDEADCKTIEQFASGVPAAFVVDGVDLTEWRGASLAPALSGAAIELFLIVKNAVCARRLIADVRPGRVVLGDGLGLLRDVWQSEMDRAGVPVVLLDADPPVEVAPQWRPRRVKGRGLSDRVMRVARGMGQWLMRSYGAGANDLPVVVHLSTEDERLFGETARGVVHSVRWGDAGNPALSHVIKAMEERRARPTFAARAEIAHRILTDAERFCCLSVHVGHHLQEWVGSVFRRRLPLYAGFLERARYRLRATTPRTITLWPPYSADVAAAAVAAGEMGIDRVLVQHEWSGGMGFRTLPPLPPVERAVCWGELSAASYREAGINDIVCGGYPLFVADVRDPSVALRPAEHEGSGRKKILYADQYYNATRTHLTGIDMAVTHLDVVISAARALPQYDFSVKFHPKLGVNADHGPPDSIQRRANCIAGAGLPNLSPAPLHSSLYDLMREADLFVTHYSTSAIQAMLFDLPVVLLNCTGKRGRWPGLVGHEGPVVAENAEAFAGRVNEIMSDGVAHAHVMADQRRHLNKILEPVDWDAGFIRAAFFLTSPPTVPLEATLHPVVQHGTPHQS